MSGIGPKAAKFTRLQMLFRVPGKWTFELSPTEATVGPIPCTVLTGLTGALTCLHVHMRVHLFRRKPNFFSCAASVSARGCPPRCFSRQEGPAKLEALGIIEGVRS